MEDNVTRWLGNIDHEASQLTVCQDNFKNIIFCLFVSVQDNNGEITHITAITIVLCMYALSLVMKNIPMGITYASFAGLTIIATVVVGVIRFNQVPNFYSLIGLVLIIIGVLMVNLLGNN